MAGLPCDACQEATPVVQIFEPTLDGNGELVKLRWRVCINPKCEKYMLRRVSVEYYPEVTETPHRYEPKEVKRLLRAIAGAERRREKERMADLPLLPWDEDENDDTNN